MPCGVAAFLDPTTSVCFYTSTRRTYYDSIKEADIVYSTVVVL